MSFDLIGTEYGGWMLNLNLVPVGSTIISAGVGEDISFDVELINQRQCKIIGIDPTLKSHLFIEKQTNLNNFMLLKKALTSLDDDIVKLYKQKNPNYVSESTLSTHHSVLNFDSYYAVTINLKKMFEGYENISVVKMDIEGSEYDVLQSLEHIPDSVKQICVEFHHFCTDKTLEDTKAMVKILANLGFKNFIEKPSTKQLNELTFWRL